MAESKSPSLELTSYYLRIDVYSVTLQHRRTCGVRSHSFVRCRLVVRQVPLLGFEGIPLNVGDGVGNGAGSSEDGYLSLFIYLDKSAHSVHHLPLSVSEHSILLVHSSSGDFQSVIIKFLSSLDIGC